MITVIHTFGRDLKWNPHIHAIVTLGGFNKNYQFLEKIFSCQFHCWTMEKMVIDIVKSGNYDKPEIKAKAYAAANYLYRKNTRFFFNVAKMI